MKRTPSNLKAIRILLAVASLALATSSWADTVVVTGTTAGRPTWNRPIAGNPPTPPASGVGTAVRYDVQQFSVSSAGTYVFQSTAPFDNYTFLYQNSFNPLSQFTNVLIGNDDNPSIGLSGFTFNLLAGTQYFFITTGFANTSFGTFSNNFSGPGTIRLAGATAVPEAGPGLLLFALVAAGFVVTRRRLATAA